MYGVEKRFKMQLLLGLKGSPLVGATILNFVTPELKSMNADCKNCVKVFSYALGLWCDNSE